MATTDSDSNNGSGFGLPLWQILLVTLLLLISVFYQSSRAFKYYFKMVTYLSSSIFIGIACVIYSLPRPRNTDNHYFVRRCLEIMRVILVGIDVKAKNLHILDEHKVAIIVVNHQSSIDMFPLFHIWPKNTVCLAKRELLYSGPFGIGSWICGTIFIDRLNPVSARKTMDDTARVVKEKQVKVFIFPEGTRNHEGSLLPFKKGAFHLAVQSQIPVIPVVFSSYKGFYSKTEKRFDEGSVAIEVLPAIPTTGLTSEDVTDLTERTRDTMLECFTRLTEEMKKTK